MERIWHINGKMTDKEINRIINKIQRQIFPDSSYSPFTEYGFPSPPTDPTVEGSVVHPTEDLARLIGERSKNA